MKIIPYKYPEEEMIKIFKQKIGTIYKLTEEEKREIEEDVNKNAKKNIVELMNYLKSKKCMEKLKKDIEETVYNHLISPLNEKHFHIHTHEEDSYLYMNLSFFREPTSWTDTISVGKFSCELERNLNLEITLKDMEIEFEKIDKKEWDVLRLKLLFEGK